MVFVVDASIVLAWLVPDENHQDAEKALDRLEEENAIVPDLLWHEIRNVLVLAERRNRISTDDTVTALTRLRQIPLKTDYRADDIKIVQLARKHRLTGYDAAYLALAIAENIPLATLDRKLALAAEAEGVAMFGKQP